MSDAADRGPKEMRQEAQEVLAHARAAADQVLREAEALAATLRDAAAKLKAEADQLVYDVQLTHRELLAELRVPGLAARDERRSAAAEPGSDEPGPIFDLPDWVGRED
jgi:hypothetical protein